MSWLEYRPQKHPDEIREAVVEAYHHGKSSGGAYDSLRESGFYVNTDRKLELREFIDVIKILARGVNLQVGQLRPEIREAVAEAEGLVCQEK
jgi:hypothetical protein